MGCRKQGECSFFEQPHMQQLEGLSSLFKTRYCDDDHERCARFKVSRNMGESAVPVNMRPNDHGTASSILGQVRAS